MEKIQVTFTGIRAETLERARANLLDGETIDELTERLLADHNERVEEREKTATAVRRAFAG